MMHADRSNRVLLGLVGLIAIALGTGGLLAAGGVFGQTFQHRRLLDNQFSTYFSEHGSWLWPAIAGASLVLALLSLSWLGRLLFSTDRAGAIAVTAVTASGTGSGGRTTLQPGALTQAVSQEIAGYHGVTGAKARVIGDLHEPTLVIDVTASRRVDLPALIKRIEREAIAHARAALGSPGLPVKLDIGVTDKGVARTA